MIAPLSLNYRYRTRLDHLIIYLNIQNFTIKPLYLQGNRGKLNETV